MNRRRFARRLAQAGVVCSLWPTRSLLAQSTTTAGGPTSPALTFPGPWSFNLPKGAIILVSDQQLQDLQDPDREIDLSLTGTPNLTTLRKLCAQQQAAGARTIILAFDHFWAQYRPGQGERPRQLMPDTDGYLRCIQRISETLRAYQLGLELSLLSPLELGPGFHERTGTQGRWVQYAEGLRDPKTGQFSVQLWEHRRWTNNKGSIELRRQGVRAFAFKERRIGGTPFYVVPPNEILELREPPTLEEWQGATVNAGGSFAARRLTVRGQGDAALGPLDRVLVVVSYQVPELDYFSPQARPFLHDLVDRYHAAGVPLNGLYSDEMHIQQDWVYHGHHDQGQFTLRFLTDTLGNAFAERYGTEFRDFEKYLVYFCYGQHSFLPGLEARAGSQHVFGESPEEVQRTCLLRRRYYDLLSRTVVDLFAGAKHYAEERYGHELEARAHATWAQSPTIDAWDTGQSPHAPRQYEYTPNFVWANTVHQAAAACDDYFRWNDFLTGGGNDHTEGGWLDRDYYALALGCSTGILNRTPYAYAAHWGMPAAVSERRQALVDAFGAAASPAFQAIEDSQHRDIEVLMLYPISLVACEERFGAWMTQYGYANYVTADRLLDSARVTPDGQLEMAGRRFRTLVALFEPLPPAGLLPLIEQFLDRGGRVIWAGPPPRLNLDGAPILEPWQRLFGVKNLAFRHQGWLAPGEQVRFEGALRAVPPQTVLTQFLVDQLYPVEPDAGVEVVARSGPAVLGTRRQTPAGGDAVYLGFRPRDDQSASLGYESRTWYEVLKTLGAYPASAPALPANDNPTVVSRETPYLACRFPNGTVTLALHYCRHVESWPGGFHRDPKADEAALAKNPLPPDRIEVDDLRLGGCRVSYRGRLVVAFRRGTGRELLAFGGYDCTGITVDGIEHRYADRPLPHLAWAPVAPARRLPGGAVLELWVQGTGQLRVPLPPGTVTARLYRAGGQPGSLAGELPATVSEGHLTFATPADGAGGHFYVC